MRTYHIRFWTGPIQVTDLAERMRQAAAPHQHVTVEGTEHIHVTVLALHVDAVLREMPAWAERAGLPGLAGSRFEILHTEDTEQDQ